MTGRIYKLERPAPSDQRGATLGKIIRLEAPGGVWVELPGGSEPVLARVAIEVSEARLQKAIEKHEEAVLVFEHADRTRPILIGLVQGCATDVRTRRTASTADRV